jgi:chemotaxis protein methyltransferase CheR
MIDKRTFDRFRELIYRESGITLRENKESLVSARVAKRMRELNISSHGEYLDFIKRDKDGNELVHLLDAISTNVTHFFREERHFKLLAKLVRRWEKEGRRSVRIWCAACSTGEEPYSVAITLREALADPTDARIIASDISTRVLEKAQRGIYEARQMENIPQLLLARYFQRGRGRADGLYRAKPVLRDMVVFRRINLIAPPYPVRGPLDVIFCRNVMIYFDNTVRAQLLASMYDMLRPNGYLMVGHAESLSGMLSSFTSVEPSVYIKDSAKK